MQNCLHQFLSQAEVPSEVVSAFFPNILHNYVLFLHRCCLHVRPYPYLEKKNVNGPVKCMKLINSMIEAAPKDVLLCSLDWAWITIIVHLS